MNGTRVHVPVSRDAYPAARVTYLLKRLELAVRSEIEGMMRPLGLTTPQYTALSVLARHPGLSSAQLARRSFVSPQAANEIVAAMERKGLIVRHADVRNRRILRISLTEAGEAAVRAGEELIDTMEDRMFTGLRAAEVEMFRSTLEVCLSTFRPDRP
jgi:DNA-binding MarR family transcriptional regulator